MYAPFKPGWRWEDKEFKLRVEWEKEDQELSPSEITRRCMVGTVGALQNVEEFLDFTMEIGEDFDDG